jgi:hypothetical protein
MSDLPSEERAHVWLTENLDLSDNLGKSILSQWTWMLRQSAKYKAGTLKAKRPLISYQIMFWQEENSLSFSMYATTAVSLVSLLPDLRYMGIHCVFQAAGQG